MPQKSKLRILLVHNQYQYRGGEEAVFSAERQMLESRGHYVVCFMKDNAEIRHYSHYQKILLGFRATWSQASYEKIQRLVRREQIDVVHFHNFFPLITPAAHHACRDARVPVVQTLHNFRLLCSNGIMFQDGSICERCMEYGPWFAILRGCYRKSRAQTAAVAGMLYYHRWRRTWEKTVNAYIALSNFSREKFIQSGLPAERIFVKPNFVPFDPGVRESIGDYVLYAGRFSPEKRIEFLMDSWKFLPDIPLCCVGTGPRHKEIVDKARKFKLNVFFPGELPFEDVLNMLKKARFLIFPSLWYENFPRILVEAFACGVPTVGSRLGSVKEIIQDGKTGLLFDPYSNRDMIAKVRCLWDNKDAVARMGRAARSEFERNYTAERNYELLMEIYMRAIKNRATSE